MKIYDSPGREQDKKERRGADVTGILFHPWKNTHARADKRSKLLPGKNFSVLFLLTFVFYFIVCHQHIFSSGGLLFKVLYSDLLSLLFIFYVSENKIVKTFLPNWEIRETNLFDLCFSFVSIHCFMLGIKYSDQIEIIFCETTSIMFKLINW